mgnify:CR=1 FL=1
MGEIFDLGRHDFSKDSIIAFARAWDPQPFHLDEAAAKSLTIRRAGRVRLAHGCTRISAASLPLASGPAAARAPRASRSPPTALAGLQKPQLAPAGVGR